VSLLQEKAKDAKLNVGSDNALFRFEWLEALTRIAIAKYAKTHAPAAAVAALIKEHIECNIAPLARIDLNAFRTQRLYCEEVDELLKRHEPLLQAMYSRWRLRPTGGGLRTKVRHSFLPLLHTLVWKNGVNLQTTKKNQCTEAPFLLPRP
jgi:hypothetical protein